MNRFKNNRVLVRCYQPNGSLDCCYWTKLNYDSYQALMLEAEETEEGKVVTKDYETDIGLGYRQYVFAD